MNSIAKEVRKAVWDAVSNISYSGGVVPCYLVAPDPPTYPYIILEGVGLQNDSAQGCTEAICSVTLEVVSAWLTDGGGFDPVDDIESLICSAIDVLPDQVSNAIISSKFVSSSPLKDYDGSRVIVRRRIELEIETQNK